MFLHKAQVLMEATSRRIAPKSVTIELMKAALHLMSFGADGHELSFVRMAQTLLKSAQIRMGSERSAEKIYQVALYVDKKGDELRLSKFVDVPAEIPPEQYCMAYFSTSSEFIRLEILGEVTKEQIEAIRKSGA